jgi:hypothetical protein
MTARKAHGQETSDVPSTYIANACKYPIWSNPLQNTHIFPCHSASLRNHRNNCGGELQWNQWRDQLDHLCSSVVLRRFVAVANVTNRCCSKHGINRKLTETASKLADCGWQSKLGSPLGYRTVTQPSIYSNRTRPFPGGETHCSSYGSTPEDPHHLRCEGLDHFGHGHGCPHDHQLEVVVGWVAILTRMRQAKKIFKDSLLGMDQVI